jgi:formate-dependent nitrite reductase membrane component NrfD
VPWHWPVPAYLVTKALGSGVYALLALGLLLGLIPFDPGLAVATGAASLALIGLTTALLVYDLERPERFLSVLLRPQWNSWLARGAWLLIGHVVVVGLWWVLETGAWAGWLPPAAAATLRLPLLLLGMPLALGVAVYTAFLFGQAEGRDLWQSPLLPVHMLLQAATMGAAALALLQLLVSAPAAGGYVRIALVTLLALDLLVLILGEHGMPHATEAAARASHDLRRGRYRVHYWGGAIALGHVLPLLLLLTGAGGFLPALAGLSSIVGLYLYEYAFVLAPQQIPNS